MEYIDQVEQLDIRIQNLEVVIQIAQMEIESLLLEKDNLTKRNPIGFKLNNKNENTTK
jgi:FtsZ-binding cell division protein ZapB